MKRTAIIMSKYVAGELRQLHIKTCSLLKISRLLYTHLSLFMCLVIDQHMHIT